VLANLIDVRDVRMVERRGSFRLLYEAPHPVVIGGKLSRQNLQRKRFKTFLKLNIFSGSVDFRARRSSYE